MHVGHLIPHRPVWPEGHLTRNTVLREAFPGLLTIRTGEPVPELDVALVDTHLRHVVPGRRVLLARALNGPEPEERYDLRLTWPYEGEPGEVIPPLVPVAPASAPAFDVLVVPSRLHELRRIEWAALVPELAADGLRVVLASGDATPLYAQARVVVGAGGTGTLYGALWAGKALVVVRQFTHEQRTRVRLAIEAGEPVVDGSGDLVGAVRRALDLPGMAIRANGVEAIRGWVEGLT